LRIDVGEQFGEGTEFDESVKGEFYGPAVPADDGGWGDESLNGDFLGVETGAEK
jgi:hypothetical protein